MKHWLNPGKNSNKYKLIGFKSGLVSLSEPDATRAFRKYQWEPIIVAIASIIVNTVLKQKKIKMTTRAIMGALIYTNLLSFSN